MCKPLSHQQTKFLLATIMRCTVCANANAISTAHVYNESEKETENHVENKLATQRRYSPAWKWDCIGVTK